MRTLPGPSVFAPFAAIVAQFTIPRIAPPRSGTLPEVISVRLPEAIIARIQTLDWTAPFETLVAGLGASVAGLVRPQRFAVPDRPHSWGSGAGIFGVL